MPILRFQSSGFRSLYYLFNSNKNIVKFWRFNDKVLRLQQSSLSNKPDNDWAYYCSLFNFENREFQLKNGSWIPLLIIFLLVLLLFLLIVKIFLNVSIGFFNDINNTIRLYYLSK